MPEAHMEVSSSLFFDLFQTPKEAPPLQLYSSEQWEMTQWALRLFQQAARKVHTKSCRVTEEHDVLMHTRYIHQAAFCLLLHLF